MTDDNAIAEFSAVVTQIPGWPVRHSITLEELDEYLRSSCWHTAAANYTPGSSKKLEVKMTGELLVTINGRVLYCGDNKATAIQTYNEAS